MMKDLIVIALTGAFLLACSSEEAQTPVVVSTTEAVSVIASDNIRTHLEFLADDALEGRATGEPGYDLAAAYVAERFAELGLEPGGDDGDWYQQVTFQSYLIDSESAAMTIHRGEDNTVLEYREDFGLFADQVRESKSVRAGLVYAGYGVHAPEFDYSDYDGIDVEGKIVVVFRGAPAFIEGTRRSYFTSARTKGMEATRRGAVGFVSVPSRASLRRWSWERTKQMMGRRPGLTWMHPSGDAGGYFEESLGSAYVNEEIAESLFEGAPLSFEAARDAAEAGVPASTPLDVEVSMTTGTGFESFQSPNVIGVVRGTDPELRDEFVVYTGHLDHVGTGREIDGDRIYNGAYDNAMGISLMIETARAFAANPPRRSVMFIALTGEERGLLGSDYFVNYPTVPVDSMVANINLDMPLFLYPLADLVAFGAEHSTLLGTVETAVGEEGFALTPDPMPEQNLFARSDQFSFVREGIPAIFLVSGFTSLDESINGQELWENHLQNDYHKPSDDLSLPVDWDSAQRFGRANARIGYRIANDDQRPVWNEGDFYGEKYGRESTTIAAVE